MKFAPRPLSFYLTLCPDDTCEDYWIGSQGAAPPTHLKPPRGGADRSAQGSRHVGCRFRAPNRAQQRAAQPDQTSPTKQATEEGGHPSLGKITSSYARRAGSPPERGGDNVLPPWNSIALGSPAPHQIRAQEGVIFWQEPESLARAKADKSFRPPLSTSCASRCRGKKSDGP